MKLKNGKKSKADVELTLYFSSEPEDLPLPAGVEEKLRLAIEAALRYEEFYFLKDYMNVSVAYPAIGFAIGFVLFAVCAVLYACGYKPRQRLRKHPSYILTACIVFVITVIIATMVAVYCKAQIFIPSQLLAYVVFPVLFLTNIVFFVTFYYLFSKKNRDVK